MVHERTHHRVIRVQVTGHVDRIAKIEAADPAIDVSQFKRVSLWWWFHLREFQSLNPAILLVNKSGVSKFRGSRPIELQNHQ